LIKRCFHFWINYYEVTHGLTRSEMNKLFNKHIAKRTYRTHFWSWKRSVRRTKQHIQAYRICEITRTLNILDSKFALWAQIVDMKVPRVVQFMKSNQLSSRTRFFHKWRNYPFEQKSLFQKIRAVLRKCFFSWVQFTWEKIKPTPAEMFRQSSRYTDLQRRLHDILKNFRLKRLPQSVWLFLRRSGRLHNKPPKSAAKSPRADQYQDQSVTNDDHRESADYRRLQIASEAPDLTSLRDVALRFPIVLYGELNKCFVPVTELEISCTCTAVFTVIFLLWIMPLLFVCAQTGGMWMSKMFTTTLTKPNAQKQLRVAMPASTKLITA
jgi:hypothetical protein